MRIKKFLNPFLLTVTLWPLFLTATNAQGKWTLGLELTRRSEIRQYEDSYKYLFTRGGGGPVFSIGGSIAFQYNEKWRFESGLLSTPYSRTVAVFYNEPGYNRLLNKPLVYINNTNTLEIPLKIVYNPSIRIRTIYFNLIGGVNTYLLAGNINSKGEAALPPIPVSPSPPTNLSVLYNTENLSQMNFSLEAGIEAMVNLGNRFVFVYRFTGRLGFIDMVEMEGHYRIRQLMSDDLIEYPFQVRSNGTV